MKQNPKQIDTPHVSSSEEIVIRFDGLEDEVGAVEGKITEVAGESSTENGGDPHAQATQQNTTSSDDSELSDRELLRERLLARAPVLPEMRKEVEGVLLEKKHHLERNIRSYRSQKDHYLLGEAIAQLRAIIRQLEIVAHASYELLKEIWLKVVHKFA